MMTVGQHDNAWLNVMNRQIPAGVTEIGNLRRTLKVQIQMSAIKELFELGLMTKRDYANSIMKLTNAICDKPIFTDEVMEEAKEEMDKQGWD